MNGFTRFLHFPLVSLRGKRNAKLHVSFLHNKGKLNGTNNNYVNNVCKLNLIIHT